MSASANKRMAGIALVILFFDQLTKWLVLRFLGFEQEKIIIEGFFKFVHWGNTGAAWSWFTGHNDKLALVSIVALGFLIYFRRHFDMGTRWGSVAMGLLFGGIVGNLIDRVHPGRRHVIDFIYFYMDRRGGGEIGFPAFNIADSAICVGVGLLFVLSWRQETSRVDSASTPRSA